MNSTHTRLFSFLQYCILTSVLTGMGCVNAFNTRFPTVVHRPAEAERLEAQIHDPYPDSKFGPETGMRPLGFTEQRSEPQRAKDRYFTAALRSQRNPYGPPVQSGPLFTPGAMFPNQAPMASPAMPPQGVWPQQVAPVYPSSPQFYQ